MKFTPAWLRLRISPKKIRNYDYEIRICANFGTGAQTVHWTDCSFPLFPQINWNANPNASPSITSRLTKPYGYGVFPITVCHGYQDRYISGFFKFEHSVTLYYRLAYYSDHCLWICPVNFRFSTFDCYLPHIEFYFSVSGAEFLREIDMLIKLMIWNRLGD